MYVVCVCLCVFQARSWINVDAIELAELINMRLHMENIHNKYYFQFHEL